MRILVTGASGNLGAYVIRSLTGRGHDPIAWGRPDRSAPWSCPFDPVDLETPHWEARLDAVDPHFVIHLAALSAAESVRLDYERALRVNVEATGRLAAWAGRRSRGLIFSSTDLVFDGTRSFAQEDDPAEPALAYGRTKRQAEPLVTGISGGLVARLSLLYGWSLCGRPAYFDETMGAIARGEPRSFFEDEYRTPLDLASAATTLVLLAERGASGTVHVGGAERMSRYDLARRAAITLGYDPSLVRGNRRASVKLAEPRPADVSLDTTRLASLLPDLVRPSIEQALS